MREDQRRNVLYVVRRDEIATLDGPGRLRRKQELHSGARRRAEREPRVRARRLDDAIDVALDGLGDVGGTHGRLRAHDPAARIDAKKFPNVTVTASPLEAADGADALLVMTPWKLYASVDLAGLRARLRGNLVIDPYAVLDETACRAAGFAYHRLGC